MVADFWFCWDDIDRCVKGTKRRWVLDWPEVPEVWPVLSGTNLNREETLLLQHAGFCLQERLVLSPRRLFNMSKIFSPILYDHPLPFKEIRGASNSDKQQSHLKDCKSSYCETAE